MHEALQASQDSVPLIAQSQFWRVDGTSSAPDIDDSRPRTDELFAFVAAMGGFMKLDNVHSLVQSLCGETPEVFVPTTSLWTRSHSEAYRR